ncbi:hypothetical protein C2G38_2197190 [Gigaspora rosea]|uniref:BTB domain-containing protein n=1 Tax=Gigaspora rosea TaxID=44941 RepID=A0A397UU74_9GLOM|nr:hypothetical protein C2G38_2197190 [Gigaspora rosea]
MIFYIATNYIDYFDLYIFIKAQSPEVRNYLTIFRIMVANFFEQLSNNLNELLKNNNEYNVIIEVGQTPNTQLFKAHSIILNSRCLYFKDKLGTITYNNNNVKIIKQANVSIEVFDIIINGTIYLENVNASVIFELLIASNEFHLEELIKHVQSFLIENNAPWLRLNFSHVYQISFKDENLKDLQQFYANIIAKHPSIIFDSNEFLDLSDNILIFILKLDDLQMDEGKIWDYTIKWGIAQNPSLPSNRDRWSDEHFLVLKNTLQNCLPLIRYFHISGEDISKNVWPYRKILDPTLWADIMLKFIAPNSPITSRVLPPRVSTLLPRDKMSISKMANCASSIPIVDNELDSNIPNDDNNWATHVPIDDNNWSPIDNNNWAPKIPIDGFPSNFQSNNSNVNITDNNWGSFSLKYNGLNVDNNISPQFNDPDPNADKFSEIQYNKASELRKRGEAYHTLDEFKKAIKTLTKSLEIEPNNAFALKTRGDAYRKMKKYKESLADLTKSLEIEPNDFFALASRGSTYLLLNKYNESLSDLNKSLKIDPNNALALRRRGNTLYMMGRYEDSLVDLNKSLEIKPNDVDALASRGGTFRMLGRYEESLEDLNKSLNIKPKNVIALRDRGSTYRKLDRYNESLVDLNKSLELEPDNAFALACRGVTYRMMGKYKESFADLEKSIKINRNGSWAMEQYELTKYLLKK